MKRAVLFFAVACAMSVLSDIETPLGEGAVRAAFAAARAL